MKILHVINGLWPGGAQVMLLRLCEELARHDVQNEVFSLTKNDTLKPQLEELGVVCHQGSIRELRRVIKTVQPTAVQGWMYHSNLAITCGTLFSESSRNQFWSIHHSIDDISKEKMTTRIVIKILNLMSRLPRKTVYVSQISKDQHEKLGYNSENSVLIPNGYDLSLFKKNTSLGESFRKELGIPENQFLFGILGRFHPMKDHEAFLDAASLFSSKHNNCGFVIAGRGTQNLQVTEWINEKGLSGKVHVLGDRRDVAAILNGIDILATSSRFGEAFPIIIGEAMSCETICCSTRVGDSEWLIGDAELISPPGDSESLANNWLRVAGLCVASRDELGRKLRSRIDEKFSLPSVAKKYLALYKGCV